MNKPKRFTLDEARTLLPEIREITDLAREEVQPWVEELQSPQLTQAEQENLSKQVQERLNEWSEDLMRFGVVAKGLWLVDFDSGSGYWCWRHGEDDILFFHGYEEGFAGRTPIA